MQGIGASVTTSVKRSGLAYKVGLGVILTGVVMFASSWLFGGVVFAAVMDLLTRLGAPEDRQFLSPEQPEAGRQILQLHGGALIASGSLIIGFRLVVELLGLTGNSGLTSKLKEVEKLGLGAAAAGFLVSVSSGLTQSLLYEILLYEYGTGLAMSTLEVTGATGAVVLLGGLAIFILGAPNRYRALLGWTDREGWGKLGCGWINQLGLGIIVLALVVGTLGFENPSAIIAAAGIGTLLAGIVPHFLARGRP